MGLFHPNLPFGDYHPKQRSYPRKSNPIRKPRVPIQKQGTVFLWKILAWMTCQKLEGKLLDMA